MELSVSGNAVMPVLTTNELEVQGQAIENLVKEAGFRLYTSIGPWSFCYAHKLINQDVFDILSDYASSFYRGDATDPLLHHRRGFSRTTFAHVATVRPNEFLIEVYGKDNLPKMEKLAQELGNLYGRFIFVKLASENPGFKNFDEPALQF